MKRLITIAMAALVCVGLTGCMNLVVPKTSIKGYLMGQPFSLTSPKDSMVTNLDITAEGTNGSVRLHIDSLTSKMNPEVITMTADGQVKIINAVGEQVRQTINSAPK